MKPHKPPKHSDVGSTNLARLTRKQERQNRLELDELRKRVEVLESKMEDVLPSLR